MLRPCPHMSSQAEETAMEECGSEWSCSLAALLRGQAGERIKGRTNGENGGDGDGVDS